MKGEQVKNILNIKGSITLTLPNSNKKILFSNSLEAQRYFELNYDKDKYSFTLPYDSNNDKGKSNTTDVYIGQLPEITITAPYTGDNNSSNSGKVNTNFIDRYIGQNYSKRFNDAFYNTSDYSALAGDSRVQGMKRAWDKNPEYMLKWTDAGNETGAAVLAPFAIGGAAEYAPTIGSWAVNKGIPALTKYFLAPMAAGTAVDEALRAVTGTTVSNLASNYLLSKGVNKDVSDFVGGILNPGYWINFAGTGQFSSPLWSKIGMNMDKSLMSNAVELGIKSIATKSYISNWYLSLPRLYSSNPFVSRYALTVRLLNLPMLDKARYPLLYRKVKAQEIPTRGQLVRISGDMPNTHFTYDLPVQDHPHGKWSSSPHTLVLNPNPILNNNIIGSVEPSDFFTIGDGGIFLTKNNIVDISTIGIPGVKTVSSKKLFSLLPLSNLESMQELMAEEVLKLTEKFGRPFIKDVNLLELRTGLKSGIEPMSDRLKNAVFTTEDLGRHGYSWQTPIEELEQSYATFANGRRVDPYVDFGKSFKEMFYNTKFRNFMYDPLTLIDEDLSDLTSSNMWTPRVASLRKLGGLQSFLKHLPSYLSDYLNMQDNGTWNIQLNGSQFKEDPLFLLLSRSPQFLQWVKNIPVTKLFHGSPTDKISIFMTPKDKPIFRSTLKATGEEGIYLSPTYGGASRYALDFNSNRRRAMLGLPQRDPSDIPTVYPLVTRGKFIDVNDPRFDIDIRSITSEDRNLLESLGYLGIKYTPSVSKNLEYVILNPFNIKSIFNNGDFSKSANIYRKKGGEL